MSDTKYVYKSKNQWAKDISSGLDDLFSLVEKNINTFEQISKAEEILFKAKQSIDDLSMIYGKGAITKTLMEKADLVQKAIKDNPIQNFL